MHRVANPAKPKGCGGSIPPDTAIFPIPHPRAIFPQMSEPGTTYVVSANEMLDTGKRRWKTLLVTKDEAAAESLKAAIEADGVQAEIETIRPPARKR
jgi:hypothetical protein